MKVFINLYSSLVDQEVFNRIFEIYLIEGWPIIYSVYTALFLSYQKQILSSDMENTHFILGKKLFEIEDIDQLIAAAQKTNINSKKIILYEA